MFSKNQIILMNQYAFLLSVFCFVQAQGQSNPSPPTNNFEPSLAVVIGIMTLMFSLTFILIVYSKFCSGNARNNHTAVNNGQIPIISFLPQNSQFSGVDKTVIESIPFFRFSSLRGSRRGLECVVCLSKFEDIEILRLLPKCKHAFHIGCIDEWLGKHASCPLCRVKVDAEDLATITYTDSMRVLSSRVVEVGEDQSGVVELYVQREDSAPRSWSSRFNFRNSLRKSGRDHVVKQEDQLPIQENNGDAVDNNDNFLHKFNHKIVLSDVVLKKAQHPTNRQGNSMIWGDEEGGISEIKEEMGGETGFETKVGGKLSRNNSLPLPSSGGSLDQSRVLSANYDKRSGSSGFSRLKRSSSMRESCVGRNGEKEDRMKRLWMPIVQRTVRWHGDRGKKPHEPDNMRESLNV